MLEHKSLALLVGEPTKDHLLDVVRSQFDQLRQLTDWMIERRQQYDTGGTNPLNTRMVQGFRLLDSHLDLIDKLCHTQAEKTRNEIIAAQIRQARMIVEEIKQELQVVIAELAPAIPEALAALDNPLLKLSPREREVLQLLINGKSNGEIAQLLYITQTTVRTYRSRVMQKLELDNLSALIKFALKHKLISPN